MSKILRRFHLVATLVWIGMTVPTYLWWYDSILWIAFMSIWANVASHWSAYQSCRIEKEL